MKNNNEFTEKDIKIVKIRDKFGYQFPDGSWLAEPEFDEAFEFEDGYATIVKDGLEGWISLEDGSAYCPWSQQERWLREYKRKRERREKILKIFGLGPSPQNMHFYLKQHWILMPITG